MKLDLPDLLSWCSSSSRINRFLIMIMSREVDYCRFNLNEYLFERNLRENKVINLPIFNLPNPTDI